MTKMQYKTRVIAVLQSGIGVTQDFFTPNERLALIQFGADHAEEMAVDPVVMVTSIELGREDWTEDDDLELTEAYLGDMLAELAGRKK
jgi:hypothetical protein